MRLADRKDDVKASYDDIVIAARELLRERGYAGASMHDIAARAGLRKSSIYNRLPNKEFLVTAVLDLTLRELLEGLPDPMLDWRQSYRELIMRIANVLGEHGGSVVFHLALSVPKDAPTAKAAICKFVFRLRARLALILSVGGFADPMAAATDALTRLQGATLWLAALGENQPLQREALGVLAAAGIDVT
nr:TetR/AcrR family transcriptional regulator [Gluconacetobacter sacchari]